MAEVIIKKTYLVNCKTCGTTLRISGKSEIYMCPTCRKLFTVPAQNQEEQKAEVAEKVDTLPTPVKALSSAPQAMKEPSPAPVAQETSKTLEKSEVKAEGTVMPEQAPAIEEDDEFWSK